MRNSSRLKKPVQVETEYYFEKVTFTDSEMRQLQAEYFEEKKRRVNEFAPPGGERNPFIGPHRLNNTTYQLLEKLVKDFY